MNLSKIAVALSLSSLATLALEFEYVAPAETTKKLGVETLAAGNVGDYEIEVVNPP